MTNRWLRRALHILVYLTVLQLFFGGEACGADWPMWRYDAARSGASADGLAEQLYLQWARRMPKPAPAWAEEQYKLQFDKSYEPIVMGKRIFVPSMVGDKVTAYDTESGAEIWRFYCDGPVRFAPVGWKERIYFVSDDGCLHCLAAADGRLIRRIRLGPSEKKIFGNGRLISVWPARGGPVLFDGKIYCAASIWPFMGIFIYAIDAESGEIVWENSSSGSRYMAQQHDSDAFGGVAPQGYLAVTEDRLLIPSRTTPACYDRRTGEFIYYRLSERDMGKHVGGYDVCIWKDLFFNNSIMYRLADGEGIVKSSVQVAAEDGIIAFDKDGGLVGYVPREVPEAERKKDEPVIRGKGLWKGEFGPAIEKVHIKAGTRLYGSNSQGVIAAVDIPKRGEKARISWTYQIEGKVWNMLAGDDKLFVVTEEGLLYCFGGEEGDAKWHDRGDRPTLEAPQEYRLKARQILAEAGTSEGYCLLLGIGDGGLLRAILAESELDVIAAEADAEIVESMRREMDEAGVYGKRVSILPGAIASLELPAYFASVIISEEIETSGFDEELKVFVESVYHSLRPYGGTAWLGAAAERRQVHPGTPAQAARGAYGAVAERISSFNLPGGRIDNQPEAVVVRRAGALPGSGDWIGQYADSANTVVSRDELKGPLGLLWFGDDSAFTDVLPRHGHGPAEQVVGGRLFIEGIDSISARDVYIGRTLWKTKLKDPNTFGTYFNKSYNSNYRDLSGNQSHIPGANTRGTNFMAMEDKVYIIEGADCRVLDAGTGRALGVFSLPDRESKSPANWAYIGVCGDYLIAGSDFVSYMELLVGNDKKLDTWASFFDKYASKRLVVMNRHTGEFLWAVDAKVGFIHNCIAAGGGRVFCLDGLPPYIRKVMAERDIEIQLQERLLALDVRNGTVIWERSESVFGSWLGYSEKNDVLLQAYRKSRDMVPEPGDRMATHRGQTGELVWDKAVDYDGPCMLRDEAIITQETAYNLLTGEQIMREHPLTGEPVEWEYTRNYGCNTVVASRNFLMFRSAAAGYFDLADDGGTGNFGGFKSGCTSNLIVANGVLNAPEYTRTCTCSYQNQTSLALVHMPEVETWTFNPIKKGAGDIRRVGINFGAPGDRKAENGTLWLDYPSRGGPSPEVEITTTPRQPIWFCRHSSQIEKGVLPWVEASGAKGIRRIGIKLTGSGKKKDESGEERRYAVRLHFAEPDGKARGERVFDIAINGKSVLKDFDIVREAGGPNIGIVKEFTAVPASDRVLISLKPRGRRGETVICGLELIAE